MPEWLSHFLSISSRCEGETAMLLINYAKVYYILASDSTENSQWAGIISEAQPLTQPWSYKSFH